MSMSEAGAGLALKKGEGDRQIPEPMFEVTADLGGGRDGGWPSWQRARWKPGREPAVIFVLGVPGTRS